MAAKSRQASQGNQKDDKKSANKNASKSANKGVSNDSEPDQKSRLPFEPAQTRKKPPKKTAPSTSLPHSNSPAATSEPTKANQKGKTAPATTASAGIPEVVSKRMARRMAFFCGVPTSLGMLTFIVSYVVVSRHLLKLPPVVVLLVSLGCFGLGVLGLSYGAFSASWDEERLGTWLGWSEFRTNLGRTIKAWRAAGQKPAS